MKFATLQREEKWNNTVMELGSDAKIPDQLRMSACLGIRTEEVREQMLMRPVGIEEDCQTRGVVWCVWSGERGEGRGRRRDCVEVDEEERGGGGGGHGRVDGDTAIKALQRWFGGSGHGRRNSESVDFRPGWSEIAAPLIPPHFIDFSGDFILFFAVVVQRCVTASSCLLESGCHLRFVCLAVFSDSSRTHTAPHTAPHRTASSVSSFSSSEPGHACQLALGRVVIGAVSERWLVPPQCTV